MVIIPQAVDAEKMEMEKALKAAQAELHLQQTEVAELQQDRDRLVSEQQEAAQVSSERVNTLEAEIAAIANQQEALQSASDEVRRLQAQVEDLQRILDSHCEEDTAKQALSEEKAELLVQVAALRTCAQEWELQEFGARQERDACREELAILHEQAEAHAGHVAELLSAQEEKTDEAAEQVR
jgi:chromosome segregation ATPase